MRWRQIFNIGLVGWMLFAALLIFFNFNYATPPARWREPDEFATLLIVALHLPLFFRERAPVTVLLTVSAISAVYLAGSYYHSVVTFPIALGIFTVAEFHPRRVSIATSLAGWSVLLFAQHLIDTKVQLFGVVVVSFICAIAWAFGYQTRRLAQRGRKLAQITEQLRREQQERAHQAVSQEQSRIARELHDVVAHHMSVISVQAGLGRYVLKADPDTAHAALDVIESTAHEALSEMRRMLAVLRVSAEDAPLDSAPGLNRLGDLLDRVSTAGANVRLIVAGEPTTLSSGMDLCVYRVIQESLTNVLKHADPPTATVTMSWEAHEVTVSIVDEGSTAGKDSTVSKGSTAGKGSTVNKVGTAGKGGAAPEASSDESVKHGLIGMRERARIYGGRLQAGPRAEGGFAVTLTLPIEERTR